MLHIKPPFTAKHLPAMESHMVPHFISICFYIKLPSDRNLPLSLQLQSADYISPYYNEYGRQHFGHQIRSVLLSY